MIGVDLFSGAGGMSLGAEWAGIKVMTAVEANVHAAKTFRENHAEAEVINKPIESVKSIEVAADNRQVIVFGGPPCQGFSTSNQRTRSSNNPINWLFRHYMRLVRSIMPDWVVFENVTGMTTTEGGRFMDEVLKGFKRVGYTTSQLAVTVSL
jgi:DNA (cytosine-5)-methyltransferase 1